ncbi:MAG: S8 family serine peptidase, partial [Chitinophagaceae bacterium]
MRVRIYLCLILALSFFDQAMAQFSDRTSRDIQLLLNEKNSRTGVQKKIDSRLLQFVREKRGEKMAAGLNLESVIMESDSKGDFEVDIQGEVTDALITRMEFIGARIISSSVKFGAVRASVSVGMVEKLAAFTEIFFIEPAARMQLEGRINGSRTFKVPAPKTPAPVLKAGFEERAKRIQEVIRKYLKGKENPAPLFSGLLNSQGDRAHRADDARNTYGYAGQGIRIGLISDSYNSLGGAAADISNGELPGVGNPLGNATPVTVVQESSGSDEGRAMMQIVHDLAPKAQLFFATAYGGPANFASNILALRNAPNNCDVIIDDISYDNEPVFYDGIIAQAVNTVTAGGALYFGSAGNEGSLAKNTAGAYESDFTDAGSTVFPGSSKLGSVHNFGSSTVPVTSDSIIAAGTFYALHWADAPGSSANDYDLFLVSATGVVKASSTNIQNGSQNPYEEITPPAFAAGDRLVIFKSANAAPRAFHLTSPRGKLKYATNGQTHGHASAAGAFAVAATPATAPASSVTKPGPFPAAFSALNQVEDFSSDGPRKIFFNSNGTPITPGNFLFQTNGGLIRNKPDITAADGVSTTVPSLATFYGTSAAAPHAGAIAGLLKSANPALTVSQIRTILTTTTADIESPGFDNVSGFGILQAFQAMQLLSPVAQATVSLGSVTAAEGSFRNDNGNLDPGEIGNLTLSLNNFSKVGATSVVGTLSTTNPGVTVLQATSAYPNVPESGSAQNLAPFVIALNSSLNCGATINFTLSVSFQGGPAPAVFQFSIRVGSLPFVAGVSSVLGSVPASGQGYTVVSGQQTGRLVRSGVASSCGVITANPGLTATTGSRQFDAYTFTN